MVGSDYESYKEFVDACKYSPKELNAGHVLSKIYLMDQLKQLTAYCEIDEDVTERMDEAESLTGINNRYARAAAIADILDSKEIGKALSYMDHDFHFPVLSYFLLPKTAAYKSCNRSEGVLTHSPRRSGWLVA